MFKKYLNRFPHALRGVAHAAKNDFGFRTQIYLGVAVGIGVAIFFRPLEPWEFLFIVLAWVVILITELQNSAIEAALDQLHPERSDEIKRSKDMAAGAVLVAGLFLLIVLVAIGYGRFV